MSGVTRRTTIKDLATHLGISHSTVSRALRGDSRISAMTIDRVRRAADKMGYRPNIMACGLVRNRTSLIGIVTSNVRGSFFPDIIDGAQEILDRRGYSILLGCSNKDTAAEKNHVETMIDKQVEGLIVLPVTSCGTNSRVMRQTQKLGLPMVIVGTSKRDLNVPSVVSDNVLGGYLATKHLIELGHRRIVYLTHSYQDLFEEHHQYGLENLQRYEGYRKALNEAGLSDGLPAVEIDPDDRNLRSLRDILASPQAPTAFFAYSDSLAMVAMHAALSWGYGIPKDVSMVGFDDVEFAAWMNPALTTIAQPKVDMGRFAAKKILNMLEGIPEDSLVCTPELRVRESTGPVPKKKR